MLLLDVKGIGPVWAEEKRRPPADLVDGAGVSYGAGMALSKMQLSWTLQKASLFALFHQVVSLGAPSLGSIPPLACPLSQPRLTGSRALSLA